MKKPQMTQEELNDFLAKPLLARVATVGSGERPHVMPVWFIYEDGAIYISTSANSVKGRNLKKNKNVFLVIDTLVEGKEGFMRGTGVAVDGKAEVLTDNIRDIMEKIFLKYVGKEGLNTPLIQGWLASPNNIVVKIKPNKVMTWKVG